ncbi:class I SAM-dependent methyltransferase [Cyclobacteriaceae bacterium YHN15]|nr:class I SAM-dependent methyltransferase [Cyclobacteriaceae bacterium YHN15]
MKKKLSLIKLVYSYMYSVSNSKKEKLNFINLIKDFPLFIYQNYKGKDPLNLELPWINISSLRFLSKIIDSEMRVLEYGSGGSTLFFSNRVKELISIEHDENWNSLVEKEIVSRGSKNVRLFHLPITTNDTKENHKHDYVSFVKSFEDQSFDLILIDGRERVKCLESSIPKLKKGGIIVFDNADRRKYKKALEDHLGHFKCLKFYGPSIADINFSETHIYFS